jgi:hypothetical protein
MVKIEIKSASIRIQNTTFDRLVICQMDKKQVEKTFEPQKDVIIQKFGSFATFYELITGKQYESIISENKTAKPTKKGNPKKEAESL